MSLRQMLLACSIATLSTITASSEPTAEPAGSGSGIDTGTDSTVVPVSVMMQGRKPVLPKTIYAPVVEQQATKPASSRSTSTNQ
jgi:hypothetical protein